MHCARIYSYSDSNGQRQISARDAPLNGSLIAWTVKTHVTHLINSLA